MYNATLLVISCSGSYIFVTERLIGQSCSQSDECFSDMAVCLNNVCLCPSGSYFENDGCMPSKCQFMYISMPQILLKCEGAFFF